jgi:hypothetical protein
MLKEKSETVFLQVLETIPILRIFSVEKAKEFYCGFLGFTVDWEHRFDRTGIIEFIR